MIARPISGLPSLMLAVGLVLSTIVLSACSVTSSSPADGAPTASNAIITSATPEEIEAESARLNRWFEEKFEEGLQRSPRYLTVLGRKEQYDKFDNPTEAEEDLEFAIATRNLDELRNNFSYRKLSDEAKLSRDIWIYQYERQRKARKYRDHRYIFNQMRGAQSSYPTFMINYHKVDERSDMEAYISRLGGISTALGTLLERAQRYAADGVRPPRFAYEGVIDQSRKVIQGAPFTQNADATENPEDSAIWRDAKAKIAALKNADKISDSEAQELTNDTRTALLTQFAPAYQALINWVESDLKNADNIATGVGKLPRGEDYYAERLRFSTTTKMSAAEIHKLGLEEVERLTAEMQAVLKEVNFKGTLQEFFTYLRNDDQFYFPNTDTGRNQYLTDADDKIDGIRKRLPEYFGVLPKGDLIVKRVEAYREQDGAPQHYNRGTPDGSRPGIYYVHLSDTTAMPITELEVVAYHEGLPGHHMQIAIAQELESVPTFRRHISFTAYIEGWALYSEWLAIEMGAYEDPYSNFGRITTEIWRAIRLVVDTGLHAMGWTEAEAIAYFTKHSPKPLESVTAEVQRYIVTPGQATSYKIGMLKIQQLRKKAEAALGKDFDIRDFHDTVLGGGALPLSLLERRIDQWIASKG